MGHCTAAEYLEGVEMFRLGTVRLSYLGQDRATFKKMTWRNSTELLNSLKNVPRTLLRFREQNIANELET